MYYGIIILAIMCFNYLFTLCGTLYTYGSYVKEMIADLGMTMSQASLGQTLLTMTTAVLGLMIGQLLNVKIKPKQSILIAAASGVIGSFLMITAVNGTALYCAVFMIFFAIMNTFGTSHVAGHVVAANWFPEHRSTALAVLVSTGGIGGFIFPTLTAALVRATGSWRSIWYVQLTGCLTAFLLTRFFLFDTPGDRGITPPGADRTITGKLRRTRSSDSDSVPIAAQPWKTEANFTRAQALRMPVFYTTLMMMVFMTSIIYCMSNTYVAYLTDRGIDSVQAAATLSFYAVFNFIGRLLSGPLYERVDPRKVSILCALGLAACLGLMFCVDSIPKAILLSGCMGAFVSLGVMTPPNVCMNLFGTGSYSQIYSIWSLVTSISNALLILSAGVIRDSMDSYIPYYLILCGALILTALLQFPVGRRRA